MNFSQIARLQQLKKQLELFQQNHPKFPAFLGAVYHEALTEGTVIEISATSPDGKNYVTNLKLKKEDLEFFRALQELNDSRR